MTISVGERLPEATFMVMGSEGPEPKTTNEIFAGKRVALFAVPGAFTPTCHQKHLPGFLTHLDDFKARGVDLVACTAVNDPFVLGAWAKETGVGDKILMLADGNADFARAIGLEADLSQAGLGVRSRRYAMLVEDGVVRALNIEDVPSSAEKSSAEELLKAL